MTGYALRPRRVPLALLAGSVLGASLVALWTMGPSLLMQATLAWNWLLIAFAVAWLVWAVGLILVGAPLWVRFERAGRRTSLHAIGLGAAATFVVTALLILLMDMGASSSIDGRDIVIRGGRTAYGWGLLLTSAGLMALAGVVVGWTVWRIAYRRQAAA